MTTEAQKRAFRKWSQKNMDRRRIYHRLLSAKRKETVILRYGGKCECCSFADLTLKVHGRRFLQIDHINGGGGKHIRELGGKVTLYDWLIRHNYPKGFRVLCASCNVAMKPGENICELHKWEKNNGISRIQVPTTNAFQTTQIVLAS